MSVFLTGHETLIVLPDYPTEGTGDYGIGAPAYRLLRTEMGVRVTRRQLWQLLHLFFAFTVFLTAATSGSMVLSLGTLAYCAACYRPVSHLLKQNDDEKN